MKYNRKSMLIMIVFLLVLILTACNKKGTFEGSVEETLSQVETAPIIGLESTQEESCETEEGHDEKNKDIFSGVSKETSEKELDNESEKGLGNEPDNESEKVSNNSSADTTELTEQEIQTTVEAQNNAQPETNTNISGKLSVSGAHLVDGNGNIVQLRGVSTHGLAWFPQYVNYDCFKSFQSWGANCIRLAMYTAEYNGYCTGDDANRTKMEDIVSNGVDYCTALGMYVIVDWHILSDSNPNNYTEMAKTFFNRMSSKYKDNTNVIYEICNEPNGGTSWADIKRYADSVIPVIKANAPDAVIIVGTPTWSQDVDIAVADPITGYSNVMYALHFYADTHKDNLRSKLDTAVSKGLPVFVSEFGICNASGNGYNNTGEGNKWIEKLDSYGISYMAWNVSNKAESSSLLSSSCNNTGNFSDSDLSESGKWYKQVLINHSGNTCMAAQSQSETQGNAADDKTPSSIIHEGETQPQTAQQSTQPATAGSLSAGNGTAEVSAVCSNSWNDGTANYYQFNCSITNGSGNELSGWKIKILFNDNILVSQNWNCGVSCNGNEIVLTPVEYNSKVSANGSISDLGLIISTSGSGEIKKITIE